MKYGLVENGLKRKRKARKRRNPATVAKAKNPARRSVSLASAKSVAKRNGLKMVSVSNPKRKTKRRKRNGLVKASTITRRNGILGNTKSDAKQVATLGIGAVATKIMGRIAQSFVSPYLAQVGVGQYAEIIVDGAVALVVTPFLAGKIVRGGDTAKMARLGGLLVVGLDVVEAFAPNALQWNPFNTNPVVVGGGGVGVAPAAVAQIAAGVASSSNPQMAAAKVGNAMLSLDTAGAQGFAQDDSYQAATYAPELVL